MSCNTETETLTKQIKEPLPPSDRIPKKLMQVIWKATEKEQGKRYQTAMEFKQAIQQSLMPDPPLWEKISDWVQDNLMVIASVLIIVAIFVFLFVIIVI